MAFLKDLSRRTKQRTGSAASFCGHLEGECHLSSGVYGQSIILGRTFSLCSVCMVVSFASTCVICKIRHAVNHILPYYFFQYSQ